MNEPEAKVPNIDFGWDAIDIFLFSNGQQHSPPRKYHLRANDLDWWDATLNHLAKLHFGSLQSVIELYTINGNKVEGPLQLTDGTPYVAVVPPDPFMDAGYEKYLLKASRSWEKRKAKKASIDIDVKCTTGELECAQKCCPCRKGSVSEGIPKQTVQDIHGHLENLAVSWSKAEPEIHQRDQESSQVPDEDPMLAELTTIKMPDDMHLAASSVMVKPQILTTENKDMVSKSPPSKIVIAAPTPNGRNGKKNITGHKTSSVTTSPRKNSSSKRDVQKKILTKIPIKIEGTAPGITLKPKHMIKYLHKALPPNTSRRPSLPPTLPLPPTTLLPPASVPAASIPVTSPPPTPLSSTSVPAPSTPVPVTTTPPTAPTQLPSTLLSIPSTPIRCHTMLELNSKGLVTDKDIAVDKDLMTDAATVQNVISDKELSFIAADKNVYNQIEDKFIITDEGIKTNTVSVKMETQTQTHNSASDVNTKLRKRMSNSNSIKVIPAKVFTQNNIINCDIPLGDNCIAVINKGNAINVNLNIELPKSQISHQNNHSNVNIIDPNIRKVTSLTNVLKMKKSAISKEDVEIPTKSLDSLICNINECYANVVVVQCACCGNNTTIPRMDAMPVYKDNNGFFILIPSPAQLENSNCVCYPNHQTGRPDKNAISALCLELCKPNSSTVFPCVSQEVGMVKQLAGSMGSQTDKHLRTICNMCLMDHRPMYNKRGINGDTCKPKCNSSTSDSKILEKIEIFVSEGSIPKTCSTANGKPLYNRAEAYTQTDWCSVLLQVKRNGDGRYSFHLPPLNVLKCYGYI